MKHFILLAAIVLFSSCTQRGCQRVERKFQFTDRHYKVYMFSGGDTVFQDVFKGIVNQEESSDGIYYTNEGKLIELSGDYVLISEN